MAGLLYLVATPIGNLEDITYRAVRVLREADLIACEDTRQTRKLLDHYEIQKPTISYHEHNEAERAVELASRLAAGAAIALVSDAGMPLVSDPGYRLVRAAIELGVRCRRCRDLRRRSPRWRHRACRPIRSASADSCRLSRGSGPRLLEALADEQATLIFYEAPHRILEALEAVEQALGPRPVVVARELTKIHEEYRARNGGRGAGPIGRARCGSRRDDAADREGHGAGSRRYSAGRGRG